MGESVFQAKVVHAQRGWGSEAAHRVWQTLEGSVPAKVWGREEDLGNRSENFGQDPKNYGENFDLGVKCGSAMVCEMQNINLLILIDSLKGLRNI